MTDNRVEKPPSQRAAMAAVPRLHPAHLLELSVAKRTDTGRVRPHNEDYVDYRIPPDTDQLSRRGSIFLVADGMGGHRAGEVASRRAVQNVIERYYENLDADVPTSLVHAFRSANQQLYRQAQADPAKAGMGTTLVAAVILDHKLYVANVGDSRAYLIGLQGIARITEDHSWVEEQVRVGLLTEEQAQRHPHRNLVTRALGSKPAVEVDVFEGEINTGDTLLLCSDGLTGRVSDAEISAIIQQHAPQEAARLLVAEANERGGNDNITVLIVGAQTEMATSKVPLVATVGESAGRRVHLGPILAGLAITILVALGGILAWRYLDAGLPEEVAGSPVASLPTIAPVTPGLAGTDTSMLPGSKTASAVETTLTLTRTPSASTDLHTATQAPSPPATEPPLTLPATGPPDLPEAPLTLGQPEVGMRISGIVTFTWTHHGSLGVSEGFQLLIWQASAEDAFLHESAPLRQETYRYDPEGSLSEDDAGDEFLWSVRVVSISDGEPLTKKAPPRSFIYVGVGSDSRQLLEPHLRIVLPASPDIG